MVRSCLLSVPVTVSRIVNAKHKVCPCESGYGVEVNKLEGCMQ